ncbi:M13-type metalloendopeptidase, partial [Metamycoplasma equirhinis]
KIVFPAAILQAPFYNEKQSSSVNYGGIGAVIAHEISHAFDNNGANFDENGNMENWWTDEDKKQFELKAKKMIELFDGEETSVGR